MFLNFSLKFSFIRNGWLNECVNNFGCWSHSFLFYLPKTLEYVSQMCVDWSAEVWITSVPRAISHSYLMFLLMQYDVKNRRSFLRRCKAENVRLCDMFIGSTLNVMSRQLKFVDYGDEYTRRRLGLKKERLLKWLTLYNFYNLVQEYVATSGFNILY